MCMINFKAYHVYAYIVVVHLVFFFRKERIY